MLVSFELIAYLRWYTSDKEAPGLRRGQSDHILRNYDNSHEAFIKAPGMPPVELIANRESSSCTI